MDIKSLHSVAEPGRFIIEFCGVYLYLTINEANNVLHQLSEQIGEMEASGEVLLPNPLS